jgi:DNA-binding GntR family transcriptional regulator
MGVNTAPPTASLHTPAIAPHGEPGVQGVYGRLRDEILGGRLLPGQVLNQVHLARQLGVSRTPLREALRMLQAEGLVRSEHQRRMRVVSIDSREIDALYAERILLESLGISLTVPLLRRGELDTIRGALESMHAGEATGDPSAWELPHKLFHGLLVQHAGGPLEAAINDAGSRAELYRRLFVRSDPVTWATTRDEHDGVLEACLAGDVEEAVRRNARHLARTALVLCSRLDPELEPRAVRQALRLVGQERRAPDGPSRGGRPAAAAPRQGAALRQEGGIPREVQPARRG